MSGCGTSGCDAIRLSDFLPSTEAGGYRPGLFYIHIIYQSMLLDSLFLDTTLISIIFFSAMRGK
jgi:hypothetical protein